MKNMLAEVNERNKKMSVNGFVNLIDTERLCIKENAKLTIMHFPVENALVRQFKDGSLTEAYSFTDGKVLVFENGTKKVYDMDDYCMVQVCNLDKGGVAEIHRLSENEKLRQMYIQMLVDGDE